MDRAETRSATWRFHAVAGALLALVAVLIPLLLACHYGALGVPRSDDWSYLRALFEWDRTGHLDFNRWVSMTLVGQLVITRPVVAMFGASITATRVLTALLGLVGLFGAVALGRALRVDRRVAYLIALCVGACPLWGSLANTYMTDVPAFAVQVLAIAVAASALRRAPHSPKLLALSLAIGFVGIAIRQYAAIPVIAIVATWGLLAFRSGARRPRVDLAVAVALLAVATAGLFAWIGSIPHRLSLSPTAPHFASAQNAFESAGGFLRLAGLMLLPVVVLARPRDVVRRAWTTDQTLTRWVGGGTAALLTFSYLADSGRPFVGNYFDRRGVLADDIIHGTRPLIMPVALFELLVVIASLSAIVLMVAMVPWIAENLPHLRDRKIAVQEPTTALLGLCIAGFAAAYELAILVNLPIFDRYMLPVLPIVGVAFARSVQQRAAGDRSELPARLRRRSNGFALMALLLVAALGVVYTAESASYDHARWHVAQLAVRQGYDARDIYAGYEWVGFRVHRAPHFPVDPKTGPAYRRKYLAGMCVIVVINPPGRPKRIVAEVTTVGWLRDPVKVYAVRTHTRCAVAPRSPATNR